MGPVTAQTPARRPLHLPQLAFYCYLLAPITVGFGGMLFLNASRYAGGGGHPGRVTWVEWQLLIGGGLVVLGIVLLGVGLVLCGVRRLAEQVLREA